DQSARGFLAAGINPKDKVALWARNTPEWLLSFFGLIQIGAIAVPIDPNATQENLF
ncbi:AMP-binding protein, partial [Candidatus Saccharibacteria bacterium]|nr:AMP-binding protein [Candidatus Saccharibacteria bacterium]